jgi:hypothetical protein
VQRATDPFLNGCSLRPPPTLGSPLYFALESYPRMGQINRPRIVRIVRKRTRSSPTSCVIYWKWQVATALTRKIVSALGKCRATRRHVGTFVMCHCNVRRKTHVDAFDALQLRRHVVSVRAGARGIRVGVTVATARLRVGEVTLQARPQHFDWTGLAQHFVGKEAGPVASALPGACRKHDARGPRPHGSNTRK